MVRAFLALLCVLALSISPASVASTSPQLASLHVAARTPLVIRGLGFKPAEKVALEVLAPRKRLRLLFANAVGSFTARFLVSVQRCQRVTAFADGIKGSRARLLPTRFHPACLAEGPPKQPPLPPPPPK